ncbi:MAG: hypothetical protein ACYDCQ_06395 [Dehalococcoidia bacterium]
MSDELEQIRAKLRGLVPDELVEQLIQVAQRAGARRLLEALDDEGRIEPCGQGCGWEGPWAIDSTLWPADRERLLGGAYVAPAQTTAAEELQRLLRFAPVSPGDATNYSKKWTT